MAVLGVEVDRFSSVRELAGNLDTTDISDDKLRKKIETWDVWVQVQTNKFDWISTDKGWLMLLKTSDLMTSAEILDGIGTERSVTQAKDQRITARDNIKALNRKDSEIQKAGIQDTIHAGPNITDELDSTNYIPDASDQY